MFAALPLALPYLNNEHLRALAVAGTRRAEMLPHLPTLSEAGIAGADVAAAIGPGLAKAALAVEVDGKQWDIFRPIEHDAKLRIITRKDPEALDLIRQLSNSIWRPTVSAALIRQSTPICPCKVRNS